MKKNLFFGLCAASMLLMTSCDKEAFGGRFGEQETNVTLSVSLPELQTATRAYGSGLNAKYLQYAVYSLDAQDALNEQIETKSLVLTQLAQNELNIKLVPGTKYAIVLWADAYFDDTNSPFTVTMAKNDNGEFVNTLVVKTTEIKTSDDNADAFFGSYEIDVTGVNKYTITDALNNDAEIKDNDLKLKRPFAQLNIASTISDYNTLVNSGFDLKKTKVSVETAFDSMDLLTGAVSGDKLISYAFSEGLAVDQYLMTGTHKLLSVNYILMSADKSSDNTVLFTYSDGTTQETKTYGNVPLRRNWRTNIYGDLFTNQVGIKVSIAPSFADQIDANGDGDADTENQYSGNNGFSTTNP